jgi:hypothetical protein
LGEAARPVHAAIIHDRGEAMTSASFLAACIGDMTNELVPVVLEFQGKRLDVDAIVEEDGALVLRAMVPSVSVGSKEVPTDSKEVPNPRASEAGPEAECACNHNLCPICIRRWCVAIRRLDPRTMLPLASDAPPGHNPAHGPRLGPGLGACTRCGALDDQPCFSLESDPRPNEAMCKGGCGRRAWVDHRGEVSPTCGALPCIEKVTAAILEPRPDYLRNPALNGAIWRVVKGAFDHVERQACCPFCDLGHVSEDDGPPETHAIECPLRGFERTSDVEALLSYLAQRVEPGDLWSRPETAPLDPHRMALHKIVGLATWDEEARGDEPDEDDMIEALTEIHRVAREALWPRPTPTGSTTEP